MSTLRPTAWGIALTLAQWAPAYAHHTLRKDVSDLVGPLAWGLFLILPVPFLIIGTIGFLLYRKKRLQQAAHKQNAVGFKTPKPN